MSSTSRVSFDRTPGRRVAHPRTPVRLDWMPVTTGSSSTGRRLLHTEERPGVGAAVEVVPGPLRRRGGGPPRPHGRCRRSSTNGEQQMAGKSRAGTGKATAAAAGKDREQALDLALAQIDKA